MIPSATRRNNVTREESGLNSVSEALRERPRRRGDRASPTSLCFDFSSQRRISPDNRPIVSDKVELICFFVSPLAVNAIPFDVRLKLRRSAIKGGEIKEEARHPVFGPLVTPPLIITESQR